MKELEEFINKIIGKYEKSADALIYESSMNIKKSQVELDEEIESLKQKASSLLHDMRIENANKYKEMFNQGITEEQKEELEQLGINKTPECQFAKYGFEVPEFEGEILKELSDHNGKKYFIGYSIDVRVGIAYPYPKTWTEDGKCFNDDDIKIDGFDLTPIKKPWYEYESNIGKLIIDIANNSGLYIFDSLKFDKDINRNILVGFSIADMKIKRLANICGFRLATKEEVLSLYKEEK